jgi:hypothetical protein
MRSLLMICAAALVITGCGKANDERVPSAQPAAAPTNAVKEQSAISQAADGFTGKTAVDAGQRVKAKIEKIDKQRREDVDEAMKQ